SGRVAVCRPSPGSARHWSPPAPTPLPDSMIGDVHAALLCRAERVVVPTLIDKYLNGRHAPVRHRPWPHRCSAGSEQLRGDSRRRGDGGWHVGWHGTTGPDGGSGGDRS